MARGRRPGLVQCCLCRLPLSKRGTYDEKWHGQQVNWPILFLVYGRSNLKVEICNRLLLLNGELHLREQDAHGPREKINPAQELAASQPGAIRGLRTHPIEGPQDRFQPPTCQSRSNFLNRISCLDPDHKNPHFLD